MSDYLDSFADSIYEEMGSPSGISPTYVKSWLVVNIGGLNTLLNTNYSSVSGTITPIISGDALYIYKELFAVKYYDRQIQNYLGAAGYSVHVQEVAETDRKIRLVSKNDVAKSYQTLKGDAKMNLDSLVTLWRHNKSLPNSIDISNPDNCISCEPLSYIVLK